MEKLQEKTNQFNQFLDFAYLLTNVFVVKSCFYQHLVCMFIIFYIPGTSSIDLDFATCFRSNNEFAFNDQKLWFNFSDFQKVISSAFKLGN